MRARRPQPGRQRSRLLDERGSALPELAIAMLVLSVAILGVVGSMGLSMQLVGDSRQRSSGVGVATERLERIHDIPYERIATYEKPKRPVAGEPEYDDPNHPNHDVSIDSTTYTLQDGTVEDLVVDEDDGALAHIDDPITVGNTEFTVFQYVTAVDLDDPPDGAEDARRVTVVVLWKYPVQSGTTDRAVQSAVITPGTITVPMPTPTELSTPQPPTSASLNCNESTGGWGETGEGTMQIISGSGAEAGFTSSTSVQITLEPADHDTTDRVELQSIVNEVQKGFFTVACWGSSEGCEPRDPDGNLPPVTVTWTIPDDEVEQTIEARFRSLTNQCSDRPSASITLDRTVPTTPGDLREVSCSGPPSSNREVTMTWDPSTDSNWLGYRIYRSIDSAPFEQVSTVGGTSASDVSAKNHNSVRYVVRAYDRAGNESADSNRLSYSKNSC